MSDYSVRSRLLVTVWSPPLRVVQKHVITIWNLHGGTLALVARRPVSEIEHLTMAQMNSNLHTICPFTDQSRGTTLPNTNSGQCCFTFGILIETELTELIRITMLKASKSVFAIDFSFRSNGSCIGTV